MKTFAITYIDLDGELHTENHKADDLFAALREWSNGKLSELMVQLHVTEK